MKRPNITPGWETSALSQGTVFINEEEYFHIDTQGIDDSGRERGILTAIAAVPELLAALETALLVIEDDVLACERSPYPCAATQEAAIARKRARLTKAKDALTKAGYEFP